jgi:hypothetical protein
MSRSEDLAAIRGVVENYFYALDSRRLDLLSASFAADATMTHHGRRVELGHGDQLAGTFAAICELGPTSHLRTAQHIDLGGHTAHSHTLAQAVVCDKTGPVHVRGLSYHDDMVRTPDGWRIRHRVHEAIWQYDATGVPPHLAGPTLGTTEAEAI